MVAVVLVGGGREERKKDWCTKVCVCTCLVGRSVGNDGQMGKKVGTKSTCPVYLCVHCCSIRMSTANH